MFHCNPFSIFLLLTLNLDFKGEGELKYECKDVKPGELITLIETKDGIIVYYDVDRERWCKIDKVKKTKTYHVSRHYYENLLKTGNLK